MALTPDVVVLDVVMARKSGDQTALDLRKCGYIAAALRAGVDTVAVRDPEDTKRVIETLIALKK
jgi:hypothetical protein